VRETIKPNDVAKAFLTLPQNRFSIFKDRLRRETRQKEREREREWEKEVAGETREFNTKHNSYYEFHVNCLQCNFLINNLTESIFQLQLKYVLI